MPDCLNCPESHRSKEPRWRAPKRDVPLSGILNVDKPSGLTSHDVVDAVRRMAGQRKVGHAGTLDPMATGVLLVCLGQATRVAEFLMAGHKRYRATITLGRATDTYDAEGQTLSSGGPTGFTSAQVEEALAGFRGRFEQVPPMYSALKKDGQPLYKLARRGLTVERKARSVQVYELNLRDWSPPSLVVEILSSPGTYVRSLAHDLGQRLGCGGYLEALVRLSSGRFALETAVSLDRLEEAFQHGQEELYLLPLDEALLDWPAMIVGAEDRERIVSGQGVTYPTPDGGRVEPTMLRAYDHEGEFLAIMAYQGSSGKQGRWRPKKVFAAPRPHDSAAP